MTTHLVTFSDESMSRARDLCVRSAIVKGGIGTNEIHSYNQWDTEQLRNEHPQLFANGKGFGYWCWKPYLIDLLTGLGGFVRGVSPGDVICYADAGIEFIAPVQHIIDRMGHDRPQDDVWLFGNNWEHVHWCKADVIGAVWPQPRPTHEERLTRIVELEQAGRTDILEAVDAILKGEMSDEALHDIIWHQFGKQCQASVIFFRVSDYSRAFVTEWLAFCLAKYGPSGGEWRYLIDDSPSYAPNHPEFREHRHDQAILTTLAYREGIKLHYWPASYNDGAFTYEKLPEYAGDDYPILFNHHRKRDHEF